MRLSLNARKKLAEEIPWVTRLVKERPCDAVRWGEVPLKAIWVMHGKPPTGTEKYRCKKKGVWKFKALKRSHAKDGVYCWIHLLQHLYYDMLEEARLERWDARKKGNPDNGNPTT